MTEPEFAGRVVLVTGAGGGIGRAAARLMHERGAAIAALDPNARSLAGLADLDRFVAVTGDAAREQDNRRAVDLALEHWGRLDAAVCCAGIGTFGTVLDSADVWDETLRANLGTAYATARSALPALMDSRGSITIVSSLAGTLAVPGSAAYTTAKHAVVGLAKSLAADFGPRGVRANALCPGAVRTPMLDSVMDQFAAAADVSRDEAYRRAASLVPLRRAAEPAEVAEIIAFLAGPRSAIVTGAVLMADCGASALDLSLSALAPRDIA
ncbi:MAG TPA: SDR family oxidoreductase [Actinospica sp.]|jgi:NAD(P)-dependent dehydrogenase (short-subunit alcohol dehydrogenase family)|nr:SDR family oxidoreductase [Actinospica sp.]